MLKYFFYSTDKFYIEIDVRKLIAYFYLEYLDNVILSKKNYHKNNI
jgi:hypothetical protein